MPTELKDLPLETLLRIHRQWLEKREAERAVHAKRREEALAKTSDRNKAITARQFEKAEAREDRDIEELKFKISAIEAQIAERDEEERKRTAARAWLKPTKAKARESWLNSGGTEASFEASWPEMERQILLQETLEILAVQPKPKRITKRQNSRPGRGVR